MAGKINSAALVLAVVTFAVLLETTAAVTHVVGDSLGWNVPQNGAAPYTNWTSAYTFTVGDVLVFNYVTGTHDVARVTKEAFNACNFTNPISLTTTGPTNFSLTSAGEYYFVCTVGQHCSLGQKLALNVTSTSGPTASPPASPPSSTSPAPAPTPSGTATPPPPPASPSPATPPSSPAPSSTPPPSGSTAPPPPPTTTAPPPGSPLSPPDTTVSPPPPPPSSSAPPKAVAAFAGIFMSIAVGVLC